jgi:hypothetical protein
MDERHPAHEQNSLTEARTMIDELYWGGVKRRSSKEIAHYAQAIELGADLRPIFGNLPEGQYTREELVYLVLNRKADTILVRGHESRRT